MEWKTLSRDASDVGKNSRKFRSNKVSVVSQGAVNVEMEERGPDSTNSVQKVRECYGPRLKSLVCDTSTDLLS